MEALFYEYRSDRVHCSLCPHRCSIGEGDTGICRVRRHEAGKLIAETWGNLSAMNFDPVEKAALSLSPGENDPFPGKCRLQYEMQMLSELADLAGFSLRI
jgi:hypothetical protein